jgi:hypothetical protein
MPPTSDRLRSERREKLAQSFPGEWVAVSSDWSRVYAHGSSYLAVCADARSAGADDPLVTRLGATLGLASF